MRRVAQFVLVCLCAAAPAARGQALAHLARGAQVRLRTDSLGAWQHGTVLVATTDSLRLRRCGRCADSVLAIATRDLRAVEVRRGWVGHTRSANAGIGAGVGAAVALAAGVLSVRHCERGQGASPDGPPCAIGYGLVPIVALGAGVLGAFVGYAIPPRQWSPVPTGGAP